MSDNSNTPTLLFDGDCSFCQRWISRWQQKVGDTVRFRPYQQAVDEFPQVSKADCRQSVQFIDTDGSVVSGAEAVFSVLSRGSGSGWKWAYDKIPGFSTVSEWGYRLVAGHRSTAASVMGFLSFGTTDESYAFSTWLFLKVLAMVYLTAFISFGTQVFGLIGSSGILPVSRYMNQMKAAMADGWWLQLPTIFGISAGDWMIQMVVIAGIVFSLLLLAGFVPRLALVALFTLYLSVVNGGQEFFSFQWDMLLLEAGFLAIFLTPRSNIAIWVFWWLLAKIMLMSGAVKLMSGDRTWETFTALSYHFETQPIPNLGGYLAHQLPSWMHSLGTFGVLAIELGAAALLGLWRRARFVGAAVIILLQVVIGLTGNYTFFNILTAGIAIMAFDDVFWRSLLPRRLVDAVVSGVRTVGVGWPLGGIGKMLSSSVTTFFGWIAVAVGVLYLTLSGFQAMQMFTPMDSPAVVQRSLQAVRPFHVTNTYGLFASMTTSRPEITIEGSYDGEVWEAYRFTYKINDPSDRPVQVAPHQPRLDWQMWFAALRDRPPAWFQSFAAQLLTGSQPVLDLLEYNPFPDDPPTYIRARVENYEFTSIRELRETGDWWIRGDSSIYLPVSSLNERTQ